MKKNTNDRQTLGIQLDVKQIQRLKAYCAAEDRSIAWFVRLAVDEFLKRKDAERKLKSAEQA
jgi:hypothetical protein